MTVLALLAVILLYKSAHTAGEGKSMREIGQGFLRIITNWRLLILILIVTGFWMENKAQLKTILDVMNEGVLVIGEKGRIRLVNPALVRLFPQAKDADDPYDYHSFVNASEAILALQPDGVMVAPTAPQYTKGFTDQLQALDIPYIYIDSNIKDVPPPAFFGQNSRQSGYFAARMMMFRRTPPGV